MRTHLAITARAAIAMATGLLPRSYDWCSTFLYLGVLINYLVRPDTTTSGWSTPAIVGLVLVLLMLDRWEYRRYGERPPRLPGVLIFALRALLIEGVVQIDGFGLSAFLYVLLPFTAALSFGNMTGLLVGGLVWLIDATKCLQQWQDPYASLESIILFSTAVIFVLTIARMVGQERIDRARAERLLTELEQSHSQLAAQSAQVAELATATERNRLAREIHDSLGHYLTAINIQLEKALAFHARDAGEARQALQASKRLAHEALTDVRRSVGALRARQPLLTLNTALAELVAPLGDDRLAIELTVEGDESVIPATTRLALYRVAQEGLTNIQRYAQAQRVVLHLTCDAASATLRLSDDGVGFDPTDLAQTPARGEGGYGLPGLRERLAAVGGRLRIDSRPGGGTRLTATIPHYGAPLGATADRGMSEAPDLRIGPAPESALGPTMVGVRDPASAPALGDARVMAPGAVSAQAPEAVLPR